MWPVLHSLGSYCFDSSVRILFIMCVTHCVRLFVVPIQYHTKHWVISLITLLPLSFSTPHHTHWLVCMCVCVCGGGETGTYEGTLSFAYYARTHPRPHQYITAHTHTTCVSDIHKGLGLASTHSNSIQHV